MEQMLTFRSFLLDQSTASEALSLPAIIIGSFRTESKRVEPNDLGGSAGGRVFLNKLSMCVPRTEPPWNVKLGT